MIIVMMCTFCVLEMRCDVSSRASVGLDQMLDENRIEDLTLFYQLLSRVHHGLKELCTSFAAYIKVC